MLTSASRTAARVAHQIGSRAVSSGRPLATAWTAPTPEQAAVPATEGKLDAVVMKFGGSSVGNAPAVRNVGRLLKAYRDAGSRTVGVLSAFYGVTDRLIQCSQAAEAGDMKKLKETHDRLLHWHEGVIGELMAGSSTELQTSMTHLHDTMGATWRLYLEAAEAGKLEGRVSDGIVTAGERMSNQVMSGTLRMLGVPSEYVPADRVIVTDGVHTDAKPDLAASRDMAHNVLHPILDGRGVPCVTGFFGGHPEATDGSVCTFGRGGSDLTASTLASLLARSEGNAAVVVWKVECVKGEDGMMADWEDGFTGVVHDADVDTTIPRLSYNEAHELVQFGKKVLHPATMLPAQQRGIPVVVKNTLRPELPGTLITDAGTTSGPVTSITKAALPTVLQRSSSMRLDEAELANQTGVRAVEDAAMLVLVGDEVDEATTREAVLSRLSDQGIKAYVPPVVSNSKHNLCVVVPTPDTKAALSALHDEMVA